MSTFTPPHQQTGIITNAVVGQNLRFIEDAITQLRDAELPTALPHNLLNTIITKCGLMEYFDRRAILNGLVICFEYFKNNNLPTENITTFATNIRIGIKEWNAERARISRQPGF